MTHSSVTTFVDDYTSGHLTQALAALFPTADLTLDAIEQPDIPSQQLVNFADAMINGTAVTAASAGFHLYDTLTNAPPPWNNSTLTDRVLADSRLLKQWALALPAVAEIFDKQAVQAERQTLTLDLPPAATPWLISQQQLIPMPTADQQATIQQLAEAGWQGTSQQVPFSQQVVKFGAGRRSLWNALSSQYPSVTRPYHPHAFAAPVHLQETLSATIQTANATPMLLMAPYALDWESLLAPIKNRPALFLFPSIATWFQCLQFPAVTDSLLDSAHSLLICGVYPNTLIKLQPGFRQHGNAPYHSIVIHPGKGFHNHSERLSNITTQLTIQPRSALKDYTSTADEWYHLTKRLTNNELAFYLGRRRSVALHRNLISDSWYDPHKIVRSDWNLPKNPVDSILGSYLDQYKPIAPRRQLPNGKKLRLAHVVPQIIDDGHAPSKLLNSILENHDRERFALSLICTERLTFHGGEYPYDSFDSPPSTIRGRKFLKKFTEAGIDVHIQNNNPDYPTAAHNIAKILHEQNIDIAVFHGPDEINILCCRLTDVPFRVMFEHGSPPRHPGFDMWVVSCEDTATLHKKAAQQMQSVVQPLRFVVNVREGWKEHPTEKSALGVPEDAQILTTVSNNLEARLGEEMCWAIGQILQQNPKAWYMPIGPIENMDLLLERFRRMGAPDRVKPLGKHAHPSQLCRCMTLFLNEFPFGSCIGMLDAMAAGCPPISMYDPEGPPQSRYAGDYFGKEYTIQSREPADYVALASRLLQNPIEYQEWSQRALDCYEQHTDIEKYVADLEKLIVNNARNKIATL